MKEKVVMKVKVIMKVITKIESETDNDSETEQQMWYCTLGAKGRRAGKEKISAQAGLLQKPESNHYFCATTLPLSSLVLYIFI